MVSLPPLRFPRTWDTGTRPHGPKPFASLDSIRMLETSYYAENGCYYRVGANCTNTTLTGVANIQTIFPGFNPGNPNSLLFNYSLAITNVGTLNAQAFTMTATGKAGTPVEGSVFTIDQDNNRNF